MNPTDIQDLIDDMGLQIGRAMRRELDALRALIPDVAPIEGRMTAIEAAIAAHAGRIHTLEHTPVVAPAPVAPVAPIAPVVINTTRGFMDGLRGG